MIISDRFRFIFVHIPKCAGVSFKQALRGIDDSRGDFSRIAEHPALGAIHRAHIPVADLKRHLPEIFAKLQSYRSVALVRDPLDRFVSAMFQRLREFKGADQSAITPAVFEAEAWAVARHLAAGPARLPLDYVHFNRQRDFIFDGDKQLVGNLFRLDQLDLASDLVAELTGIRIPPGDRSNRSVELRVGPLRPLVQLIRAPYALVLPIELRQRMRSALIGAGWYRDLSPRRFLRPESDLAFFVRDHYAEDVALFERARRPRPVACAAA